jgi:hypothetical protein
VFELLIHTLLKAAWYCFSADSILRQSGEVIKNKTADKTEEIVFEISPPGRELSAKKRNPAGGDFSKTPAGQRFFRRRSFIDTPPCRPSIS